MVLLGSKKPASFPLGFLSSSLKLFTFVLLAWVDCSSLFALHCVDPCWDHCRWRRMASIKVNQRNSHEGKPRCHFLGPNGQYSLYLVFLSRLLCRSPSKCTFPLYIQSKCSHNWHFENGMPHIIACVSCQSILWVTSQHLWLGCRVNANKVTAKTEPGRNRNYEQPSYKHWNWNYDQKSPKKTKTQGQMASQVNSIIHLERS